MLFRSVGSKDDDDAREVQKMDERLEAQVREADKAAKRVDGAQRVIGRMFKELERMVDAEPEEILGNAKAWLNEKIGTNRKRPTHEHWVRDAINVLDAVGDLTDDDVRLYYPLAIKVRHRALPDCGRGAAAWAAFVDAACCFGEEA